ncbi:hypothetical protein F383_12700 [Gossypium arboreum]|uniref:Uncharacterized protein n=1 Tax=Gossypium arboreum TaxID=29729 RepID=A0A0B0PYR6_GOSAR|nr:hypothetical protein F383_12700 [Gossypium arboreum]
MGKLVLIRKISLLIGLMYKD